MSFGRAVIGLKFTHHLIKHCALEKRKAVAHSYELWMQSTEERRSHYPVSLTSHGGVGCFTGEKYKILKDKDKRGKILKKKKNHVLKNVQIKSNILMTHLHVLLTILIMWMITLCMILEYLARNSAQNMENMVIHN